MTVTGDDARVEYRTCPLCEATCGLELHLEGRRDHARAGRPRRRVQPRLPLPEGHGAQAARGRPRPAAPRRRSRTGDALARGDAGTRPSPRSSGGLPPIIEEHGRDAVAVYLGNPSVHNLAGLALRPRRCCRRSARTNVYSASTVDQMPKQVSAGLMFGDGAQRSRSPTSTAPTTCSMLGANPFASNGSLMTAPDLPGRLEALRARGGTARGRRPAPHRRRRRRPTSTSSSGPAPTRTSCSRMVHTLFAEGLVDLGDRRRATSRGVDEVRAARRRLHAGGGRAAVRHRRRTPSGASPASSRPRRPGGGVRPHRHVHAGVRHARVAGSSTCSTCSPATSTARAARCSPSPRPAAATTGGTRRRRPRACGSAGATAGCAASPEVFGEFPVVVPRRGDRDAGRGPDPRAGHASPATRCCRRPTAARLDRALGVARLHGERRHLPQRDDAPRRRDPAAPSAARARPLRPRASTSSSVRNVANYSPPVVDLEPGEMPEWEIAAAPGGDRGRPGRGRRHRRARRLRRRAASSTRPCSASGSQRRGPRRRRAPRRRSRRAPGPGARRSTSCCAPVRTATASAPTPTGSRSPCSRRTRTASTSGRSSRGSPRCCARRAGRSSSRPSRSSPTSSGSRASLGAHGERRTLVLVGRRDLRSNNSWMHNLEVLVKGKARCTLHVHPDDARALRSRRRARPRGSRRARARSSVAGRGHRRDHAGRREHPARLGPRRRRRPTWRSRAPRRA